jgi:NitT/TauT family transport system substrate-binding protein
MLDRRRVLKGALATVGSFSLAAPAIAQRAPMKVRYNEVVRSISYGPAYAAITKGFFKEAGIEITLATAQGGDKSVAALLSNAADIALIGPESAIYVQNSDSPTKIPIFCGLTSTDGFMLVGREKVSKFEWSMLKGKEILGFRPGSTPLLYFEAAMRQNGIDPLKDVKLVNNVAMSARVGSWLAGQNQFGIFTEPDASQLELDGKGYFMASVGETVGPADWTTFVATDRYIRENPEICQAWVDAIAKAMKWTAGASTQEVVDAVKEFFPGIDPKALAGATNRYRKFGIWKTTPSIQEKAMEKFQDILVQGGVLEPAKRVKFKDLVVTKFTDKGSGAQ